MTCLLSIGGTATNKEILEAVMQKLDVNGILREKLNYNLGLQFISDDMFENKEEVLEIIKRIHIPGYEYAKNYIGDAISEGIYEPNTKESYCSQADIEKIIKFFNKH